jgi:enoyl-CoA hydratase/carnithine racemase
MEQNAVVVQFEGPLARITLNRPTVLNAMNLAWVRELEAAVDRVAADAGVRVVLIRGAGRAFCAGLDLNMMGRGGMPAGFYESQERAFRALELVDAIVVAALHGYCLGGGLQLAIACDIRVCSTDCRLGLPAIQEGLFPGMAPFRLPRLIGLGPARRLILSGEIIVPEEALRLGLVDHLVPAERFEEGLAEILERYLTAPRAASVASKRLMQRAFDAPLDAVYAESLPLLEECQASPEVATAAEAWRRRQAERADSIGR